MDLTAHQSHLEDTHLEGLLRAFPSSWKDGCLAELQTHINVTVPEEIMAPGGFPQGFPVSYLPALDT